MLTNLTFDQVTEIIRQSEIAAALGQRNDGLNSPTEGLAPDDEFIEASSQLHKLINELPEAALRELVALDYLGEQKGARPTWFVGNVRDFGKWYSDRDEAIGGLLGRLGLGRRLTTGLNVLGYARGAVSSANPATDDEKAIEEEEAKSDSAEVAILNDPSINKTEKKSLVAARRGQGKFRANIKFRQCRVTGVTDGRFLVASHIKPWRVADNIERLDGENGMLLTPHVDRLFDRGYITFNDDGTVLVSDTLCQEIIHAMGLNFSAILPQPLSEPQRRYMEYHRTSEFEKFKRLKEKRPNSRPTWLEK